MIGLWLNPITLSKIKWFPKIFWPPITCDQTGPSSNSLSPFADFRAFPEKKEETLDRELDYLYLMLRPPLKNIKSYNSFKKLIKDYVQPERSSLLLLVVSSQLPIIY